MWTMPRSLAICLGLLGLLGCTRNTPPYVEATKVGEVLATPTSVTVRAADPEFRPLAFRWLVFETEIGTTGWTEEWREDEYWYSELAVEQELLQLVASELLAPPETPNVKVIVADGRSSPVIWSWALSEADVDAAFSISSSEGQ